MHILSLLEVLALCLKTACDYLNIRSAYAQLQWTWRVCLFLCVLGHFIKEVAGSRNWWRHAESVQVSGFCTKRTRPSPVQTGLWKTDSHSKGWPCLLCVVFRSMSTWTEFWRQLGIVMMLYSVTRDPMYTPSVGKGLSLVLGFLLTRSILSVAPCVRHVRIDEEAPFPSRHDSLQYDFRAAVWPATTYTHPCVSLLPEAWMAKFSLTGTKQSSTNSYLISDIVSARGKKYYRIWSQDTLLLIGRKPNQTCDTGVTCHLL